MSTRPRITPHNVLLNGDMTQTLVSTPSIILDISQLTYEITWSGTTPIGTVNVQISNDYRAATQGQPAVAGTWNTLTLSGIAAVSGNTGVGTVDIAQTGAYAIRVQYVPTSGSGVLNVIVAGKAA